MILQFVYLNISITLKLQFTQPAAILAYKLSNKLLKKDNNQLIFVVQHLITEIMIRNLFLIKKKHILLRPNKRILLYEETLLLAYISYFNYHFCS